MTNIRTRFAPSPTGYMHVGGVRTALFAWLLAKKHNGTFILRIEDTDRERLVPGSTNQIEQSLRWLGIDWQEGVDIGGPNGPYIQSERLDIYNQWARKLIEKGRAYADPYTKEQLEEFRNRAMADKKPFLYRDFRPENPPVWDGTTALRFKSDPKPYKWTDAVMGEMSTGPEVVDDFILVKSDGFPTYNFCHIIDDMLMGITHVLRSQEFISSMPKYLNLYEALEITPPVFATLPYVMSIDGKKKLGKRDGAKDILEYRADGFLPEALVNFLATLGWNDGTEQEIYSVDELISKFSLERVQKSPARFDERRLLWVNGQWIRKISIDELYERCRDYWPEVASNADEARKRKILEVVKDRLKTLADLPLMTSYFFTEAHVNWEMAKRDKQISKLSDSEIKSLLQQTKEHLTHTDFDPESLQNALNSLLESTGQKPAVLFGLIRLAVTWAPFSPALNETLAILGHDTILERLSNAIDSLA